MTAGTAQAAPAPGRRHNGVVDLAEATRGAQVMLAALGWDLSSASTARTPERMARALAEMCTSPDVDLTTFPNDGHYRQLVIERDIPFISVCEHHGLTIRGTASIGYLPAGQILGLSKLARVLELFARGPQVQERLTQQVADYLNISLRPQGVGVIVKAEHLCMSVRGARAQGASTITSALHGLLLEDPRAREEFFLLAGLRD